VCINVVEEMLFNKLRNQSSSSFVVAIFYKNRKSIPFMKYFLIIFYFNKR